VLKEFVSPDGRTLLAAEVLRERLGGISAVTEWRRRRRDPTFPTPIELNGRHYYFADEADRYIRAQLTHKPKAVAA
jgi:hypothetical protein